VLLGILLSVIDQTIVATALPVVVTELGGAEVFTWVTTIYLLTSTISIPFYGRLSDMHGRKPMLLIGMGLFLVGSLASGLAQEMWQLIAARALQGLGAGALFPIALAVIGDLYAPAERAKPQSLFGAVFALAAIVGPTLGGFLTEALSWRWVFFVNLPIGLVAMGLVARILPATGGTETRRLDVVGALAFVAAVGLLLVGLSNASGAPWADLSVAGFVIGGLALIAVFVAIETRVREPIIPLELFRNRTFAISSIASFLFSIAFLGAVTFLPLLFQAVDGSKPTEAGFTLLALLIGLVVGAVAGAVAVSRTGRYKALLLGAGLLSVAGLGALIMISASLPEPLLWAAMFVTGVGLGPSYSIFTTVVQNGVPAEQLGVATSSLTFFRQIGGAVGLAVLGTLFVSGVAREVPVELQRADLPPAVVRSLAELDIDRVVEAAGGLGDTVLDSLDAEARTVVAPDIGAVTDALQAAISTAVSLTFVAGAIAALAAVAVTAALREQRLRSSADSPTGDPPPVEAEAV
jgi:EmrB/QacA subfamily drug resistance transporter